MYVYIYTYRVHEKNVYILQQMASVYFFRSWNELSLQYVVWCFLNRCRYSHDCQIMWHMTYDSERRWPEHGWRLRNKSPFWSCISSLKMSLKFNVSGSVSFKHDVQHAWQLLGFVKSLIHIVPFVMCMGEDLEGLVQLQVLLLRLWFWKGLQRRHGNMYYALL